MTANQDCVINIIGDASLALAMTTRACAVRDCDGGGAGYTRFDAHALWLCADAEACSFP
jgi:hypothetical protein